MHALVLLESVLKLVVAVFVYSSSTSNSGSVCSQDIDMWLMNSCSSSNYIMIFLNVCAYMFVVCIQ